MIISHIITKIVGIKIIRPPIDKVKTNSSPGISLCVRMNLDVRSNKEESKINDAENIGMLQIKKLFSLLRNGSEMKKIAITTRKSNEPPQAEIDRIKKSDARINLITDTLPLLNLIPDTKR